MTLVFRYVCADQQGEADVQSGWQQTHDFIEAELHRLAREQAGAMVRMPFEILILSLSSGFVLSLFLCVGVQARAP